MSNSQGNLLKSRLTQRAVPGNSNVWTGYVKLTGSLLLKQKL